MALSYKARRRWSLFIVFVGLPVYVVIVANLMTFIGRLPLALELLAYIVLGVVWVLPFKFVFLGVGQADPNAKAEDS
jgi:hypothetical protein